MDAHVSPAETASWLRQRMDELDITCLNALGALTGIGAERLALVFDQDERPSVADLDDLAAALQISVYELLIRIGVVDRTGTDAPRVERHGNRTVCAWRA